MAEIFDQPPVGYVRKRKAWLRVMPSPHDMKLRKALRENRDLQDRVDAMEARLAVIEKTKSTSKKVKQ